MHKSYLLAYGYIKYTYILFHFTVEKAVNTYSDDISFQFEANESISQNYILYTAFQLPRLSVELNFCYFSHQLLLIIIYFLGLYHSCQYQSIFFWKSRARTYSGKDNEYSHICGYGWPIAWISIFPCLHFGQRSLQVQAARAAVS